MFLHYSGLSLIIHLIIIFVAVIVNFIKGKKQNSAFQTYNKKGGITKNSLINRIVSVMILVVVIGCISILFAFSVATSLEVGATESQVIFAKWLFALLVSGIIIMVLDTTFQMLVAALGVILIILFMYMNRLEMSHYFFLPKIVKRLFSFVHPILQNIKSHSFKYKFNLSLSISAFFKNFIPVFIGVVVGLSFFFSPLLVHAQIVEPGFESEVVAGDFSLATAVAFTQDGRILIAEKSGTIKVVKNGVLLAEPLVTLTDVNTFGDRGLLGIAVDPNFSENGYIYVSYTYENSPGFNIAGPKTGRIVRLTVVGDTADESSKFVLVGSVGGSALTPSCEDFAVTSDCIPSDSNSHSVGGLRFGPDGKLYATLGDGSDFVDVDPRALRAQNIDSLAGKMLRINTDGTAPVDNPFYNGNANANRSKVYAFGFRNAFRFNFNPTNGVLYAGDVGWSSWEEINVVIPGGNYGWPCREGNTATTYSCSPSSSATNPLYTYPHNSSGAGSITSGAFFSNSAYPAGYANSFFIADYAQMWMKRLVLNSAGTAVVSVEDFIVDSVWPVEIITGTDGNIYYLDIVFGTLNRLTHTNGNRRPVVNTVATPNSGLAPLSVKFSSAGTYDPDSDALSYAWDFADGSVSTLANPTHVYTQNGTFSAVLTVTDVHGAEVSRSVDVIVGNQVPEAIITNPSSGSLYNKLEQITVTGLGVDPELGDLPASAFSWKVVLHHNVHTHTIQQFTNTKTITFTADDHDASDVYLEIILTVTDGVGLTDSQSINMYLNNGVGSGNLISNPSLEIEGALPSSPLNWYQGWYGLLNPIFTYPADGLAGASAAAVEITSYTNGNAKWYFSPAYVTAGKTYHFSNLYTATVPTNITAQFGRPDGTYQYLQLGIVDAVTAPTRTNFDLVIPAGIETVTIFHEIDQVGKLTIDDYSLALANGGDVILPTGSITTPVDNAVVTGIVNVNINAADNVGVASVHLLVDGVETGVGDSETPFSVAWDTTTVADGIYKLSAHIHDTSANEVESAVVNVTVNNATASNPVNLITNGDFEIADGNGNPVGWVTGGWGTHTRVYTYPVTGFEGGSAARVDITKYDFNDTGDAKWQFNDVAVTPGTKYTYTTKYQATSISDIIGRYTFADGSLHYFGLIKEIQPAAQWTTLQNTFIPPVGAVSVTFFHLLSSVATLIIDDVALYSTGTGTPAETKPPLVNFISPSASSTLSGVVTLVATSSDDTAVVGVYFAINGKPFGAEVKTAPYQIVWDTTTVPDGTYVLKATAHDPYGNNDKKEIVVTVDNTTVTPPPTSNNLILNASLETPGAAGNPANWNRGGWGTNNRVFTYPVTGATGSAAQVEITTFTNGDAKWYFDPVTIKPNTQYTVGDKYNSTALTEVLVRYTLTDGSFQYRFLAQLPATSGAWNIFSQVVTTPANATAMTLFHVLIGVGKLSVDDVSVLGDNVLPPTDTISPAASVASPLTNSAASGTINVQITATDNVAVAEVTLLIDGNIVGTKDTVSPYTFSWDSTTVANGVHTISALVVDSSGNTANAPTVSVTVNNGSVPPPIPSGNNLILNPSLDIVGTNNDPVNWKRGGWGTNDRAFTYPIIGQTDDAARVAISNYTSGDAKWYFDDVAVTPGEQYTFSYNYKSDVTTNITVRYTRADGTVLYVGMANPVANANWTSGSFTIVPPAGVVSLTVMHILNKVGWLEIDNQSLSSAALNTNAFSRGKVSFSFDDGWLEHSSIAAPVLSNAGLNGTFYVVSNEMLGAIPTERLHNPTLNVTGANNDPINWNRGGWGTNDRVFTYPVVGQTDNAARVAITSYTSGDAKWYFDDVAVLKNIDYIVKGSYQSNVETELLVRYLLDDGTYRYQFLTKLPATTLANWGTYEEVFTTPANASAITIFHVLTQVGELITDDVSVKQVKIYADTNQVLAMQALGHEIGAHTQTHTSLTTLSTSEKTTEITGSKTELEAEGFTIKTIAYPYGAYDDEIKSIVESSGFTLARSVDRGFNNLATDHYALQIQQVGRNTTLPQLQSWIDQAAQNDTWLILMFHQINDNLAFPLGITETDFTQLVNYTANAEVDVITVAEGAALLNN